MSGAETLAFRAKQFLQGMPGKKGIDIPEDIHEAIYNAASGITHQIWGRPPTPEQMQWLYDNGHHTPDKIQEQFGKLEHPYASGLLVSEYPDYADAYHVYQRHR